MTEIFLIVFLCVATNFKHISEYAKNPKSDFKWIHVNDSLKLPSKTFFRFSAITSKFQLMQEVVFPCVQNFIRTDCIYIALFVF